ncbi:MAG: hypothetical protein IJU76_04130 [Desulfovibrionaceae bacterium]|nr:hypothetical protein [Desulfovibrionaceae bacterium]
MNMTLDLMFLSDWHISQGIGDGFRADAVLVRDADGFPYVPGRALKGAMREGASRLGLCRDDLQRAEDYFFGTRFDTLESNKQGRIRLSQAKLPQSFKVALDYVESAQDIRLADKETFINDLTILRSQTALTPEGLTKKGSLRTTECGIPGIPFEASLTIDAQGIPESWLAAYMASVCRAVRSIGGNRSRGFGRCTLSIRSIPFTGLPKTPFSQAKGENA